MKLAMAAFTARGAALGRQLAAALTAEGEECSLTVPARLAPALGLPAMDSLADWTAREFARADGLVFVGACGIAVRAIAPHVKDKLTDPAVAAVDEAGRWVVPLLSGHVGGANDLARRIAAFTGGQAAVSTATDVNGLFAVDQWAARQGFTIEDRTAAKAISAALLAGETVGFASEFPVDSPLPKGVTEGEANIGFSVTAKTDPLPFGTGLRLVPQVLRLVPQVLRLGIGCRRGTTEEAIAAAVDTALAENGFSAKAVAGVGTIDLKKDEAGLLAFCAHRGWKLDCYSAEELLRAEGEFTPSDFVKGVTGVDNVCERSAVMGGGQLVIRKRAANGVTVAAALLPLRLTFE